MSKTNGHESVYSANDWDILKYVHEMLVDGNVLNTAGDKPIVSFKYPEELQVTVTENILNWIKLNFLRVHLQKKKKTTNSSIYQTCCSPTIALSARHD